ncbi:unnamed protein product [marine sediment metagenome]|uniref:Uncharacterized protein n=1 Tax=marine sediment metagenome TaxID=412755 RepID=X1RJ65_9ZZZZ
MPFEPGTGLILFVVGGVGLLATATGFKVAERLGPKLEAGDLLPMPFPHPPLPRFMYKKSEVLEELGRR